MRVVAMVSGGKDSCYNMMQCVAEGHTIIALANVHPKDKDELDSYMYQTVGHMGIEMLAEAMELPLFRIETNGITTQHDNKNYIPKDDDEVEDLYNLLKMVRDELNIEAVAVGAIFSDYQRIRVENVCTRLNLVSLAYLWRRDQIELLQEMIDCQIYAIVIKVASLGLLPDRHLGKSLRDMQPHLLQMKEKYGLNVCGEGGEYETFTLNCPLFKKEIVVDDMQSIISSSDPVCPIGYINFTKLRLIPKDIVTDIVVKKSLDYIVDLNESSYSDLSDPDLSESELEQIEKENRLKETMNQNDILNNSRSNSINQIVNIGNNSTISIVGNGGGNGSTGGDEDTNFKINNGYSNGSNSSNNISSPLKIKTDFSLDDNSEQILKITPPPQPQSQTQPPISLSTSPFRLLTIDYEYELQNLHNKPNVARNLKGWMWISGIQGHGDTTNDGMLNALKSLKETISNEMYALSDICYITLYVRNMNEYSIINKLYSEIFNFTNPPNRVCVQCPLPQNCHVILEAIAYHVKNEYIECLDYKRQTMHVQGISHWAPANIGPYSQSTRIGDIIYISGQIALVPGSMEIIDGGIRPQCKLTLRHISRIAMAMNGNGQLRNVVQGICFITNPNYISEARRQWERRTTNAIVDYIVVPALPRQALVEWQVWAHIHNDKFDYEETGCSIGDYTVFIRKRWNYENNCAAIVCYVSTGLATSTTQLTDLNDDIIQRHKQLSQEITRENIMDILQYTFNKLLKGYSTIKHFNDLTDNNTTLMSTSPSSASSMSATLSTLQLPAIHIKIFYQMTVTPDIDLLMNTIEEFKLKQEHLGKIAFTIIPALNLQNFSTFISICGVRHE